MELPDPLRAVGLLLAMGLAAGCGGGGGGSSTDPNAPVIVNPRVSFGATCTLTSGQGGTMEVLSFDYTDADGNTSGGTLETTAAAVAGGPIVITAPIPSPGVTITGTTSGTISATFCVFFGGNASATMQIRIADASGRISNTLTLEVVRPPGAPLLPNNGDPALRMAL
jgi:hypothetical protein